MSFIKDWWESFSVDLNHMIVCIFLSCSNWFIFENWSVNFWYNLQWNIRVVSNFENLYFTFLFWSNWIFNFLFICDLSNWNVSNTILCDWYNFQVLNGNKVWIIYLKDNSWNWFHQRFNFMSKNSFVCLRNDCQRNVSFVSNFESVNFTVKGGWNCTWKILTFSSFSYWDIFDSTNNNWFTGFA